MKEFQEAHNQKEMISLKEEPFETGTSDVW